MSDRWHSDISSGVFYPLCLQNVFNAELTGHYTFEWFMIMQISSRVEHRCSPHTRKTLTQSYIHLTWFNIKITCILWMAEPYNICALPCWASNMNMFCVINNYPLHLIMRPLKKRVNNSSAKKCIHVCKNGNKGSTSAEWALFLLNQYCNNLNFFELLLCSSLTPRKYPKKNNILLRKVVKI